MAFHVSSQGNSQQHFVPMDVLCIRHFSADMHALQQGMKPSLHGRHVVMVLPGLPLGHELMSGGMGNLLGRQVLAVVNDFGDLIPVGVV